MICVLVCALVSAGSRPALAQAVAQDDEKRLGDEAMVSLHYDDALVHYRLAYEKTKSPAILYNMGRAYQALGDYPRSLESLEAFAEKAPPELKARVAGLDSLIAELGKRVATVIIAAPVAGAEIRFGNKVVATTKTGQTIVRTNVGAQTLTVTHKDYFPFEKTLTLVSGKIETVEANMASRSAGGLVVVSSPIAGADVSFDGASAGNVPTEIPAKPGQHHVVLRRDGYEPAEASIVLAAGERKEVKVPMVVHETITGKWWFWTGVGVVVAGAAIAIVIAETTEKSPGAGTIAPGTVKAQGFTIRF